MKLSSDPVRFLGDHPDGAILDEVQRVPDLLSYIQTVVDEDQRDGRLATVIVEAGSLLHEPPQARVKINYIPP